MNDSVITIDEIRLKLRLSHTTKKQKLFQQILMKKKYPEKHKISILYLHFYQLL